MPRDKYPWHKMGLTPPAHSGAHPLLSVPHLDNPAATCDIPVQFDLLQRVSGGPVGVFGGNTTLAAL